MCLVKGRKYGAGGRRGERKMLANNEPEQIFLYNVLRLLGSKFVTKTSYI